MAYEDEDPFGARPRKPVSHEIGQGLDSLSVDELDERIELLKAEITRLERAREGKLKSRDDAASFFKPTA
jgi:uncharacterized small protein (DUF1192 family)